MYAVMNLSGQEYVDEDAQRAKKRAKAEGAAPVDGAASPDGAVKPGLAGRPVLSPVDEDPAPPAKNPIP